MSLLCERENLVATPDALFGEIGFVGIEKQKESRPLPPARWQLPAKPSTAEATESTRFELATHFASKRRQTKVLPRVAPSTLRAEEVEPKVKWRGRVTDVSATEFSAFLQADSMDQKAIVAKFDRSELTPDDQELLRVGSQLVWSIYVERHRGGLKHGSVLYVRRLPMPTQAAIKEAQQSLEDAFADLSDDASAC